MPVIQKITPCLWFDSQAEEAVAFYTRLQSSKVVTWPVRRGREGDTRKAAGSVMTVAFELDGQNVHRAQRRPVLKFNEAIRGGNCETQAEVDHFWTKLRGRGPNDSSALQKER